MVDGHHRLLVADLFFGESEVWVPSHNKDFFTDDYPDLHGLIKTEFDAQIERLYNVADRETRLPQLMTLFDIRQLEPLWFLRTIDAAQQFYTGRKRNS